MLLDPHSASLGPLPQQLSRPFSTDFCVFLARTCECLCLACPPRGGTHECVLGEAAHPSLSVMRYCKLVLH